MKHVSHECTVGCEFQKCNVTFFHDENNFKTEKVVEGFKVFR